MRLENVVALTHGELVNSPFVHTFTNIVFDARHVKRGDLFIAFDEQSIEDAISNGAYGIVFDKPTQISDSEIAWIKVKNLEDALTRLLRFQLIDKEITVFEADEIVLELALQIITDTTFIPITGDIKTVFQTLSHVEDGINILFCPQTTNVDIFTHTQPLPNNEHKKIEIIEQTLFETSFIYDNIFYERQLLSPFFIPYLEQLLYLFTTRNIPFRLKKFTPMKHFEAVFVNKRFEIKEFGTSDMVLIFEKNSDLIEKEIYFLQQQASWAKILYILPETTRNTLSITLIDQKNLLFYKQEHEIKKILQSQTFHFALVVGVDSSFLETPFIPKQQMSLFDF